MRQDRFRIDSYRLLDHLLVMVGDRQLRSRDSGAGMLHLTSQVWVRCPRCGNAARVGRRERWAEVLTCGSCGLSEPAPLARSPLGLQRTAYGPIRCNGCGGAQPVRTRRGRRDHFGRLTAEIRCRGCGHADTYTLIPVSHYWTDEGRYLGMDLFLSEPVGSHTLWAVNLLHLDLLDKWLRADLRERALAVSHSTMIERLPRWLKLASAREPALRAVERMRAAAAEAGIA